MEENRNGDQEQLNETSCNKVEDDLLPVGSTQKIVLQYVFP